MLKCDFLCFCEGQGKDAFVDVGFWDLEVVAIHERGAREAQLNAELMNIIPPAQRVGSCRTPQHDESNESHAATSRQRRHLQGKQADQGRRRAQGSD